MGNDFSDLSEINELDDNDILSTPEDYLPHSILKIIRIGFPFTMK